MELDVYKTDGLSAGDKLKLPKNVFGAKPNDHLIYQAVRCEEKNKRQGNAATKTRSMVRGGGRKPWRQKGRGTARVGTIRSPLWVGGGRIFGPHPRDLKMKMNKKMKKTARVSAYSYKAMQNEVMIIDEVKIENPKTREIVQVLKNLNIDQEKVLLLLNDYDAKILRASRNIPKLVVRQATDVSTVDILKCDVLLIEKNAIEKINEVCTL